MGARDDRIAGGGGRDSRSVLLLDSDSPQGRFLFRYDGMTAPSHSREPHLASPETNPSFTKGVFLGEIREDLVFPFPTLSSDERESLAAILDSLRAFAAEHVNSAKFDHDGQFPDGVR